MAGGHRLQPVLICNLCARHFGVHTPRGTGFQPMYIRRPQTFKSKAIRHNGAHTNEYKQNP